jgi:hypothetical protein
MRCILFTYTLAVQFASLVYCHVSTAEPTLTGKQVRFVKLFPGRFGDPIHVDFDVQDSSNATSYVALSYSWGPPENTKTIFRKNESVPVGENLYQALQDLRDLHQESLWWIDALSINQTNLEEKESQVRHMDRIYRHADHVVVHLNAHVRDTEPCSIPSMLVQEYWSRVWIVQEVGKAQTLHVHCGPTRELWDEFLRRRDDWGPVWKAMARKKKIEKPAAYEAIQQGWKMTKRLAELRELIFREETVAFTDVLQRFADSFSTVPRDRILAFMGVSSTRPNIPVDYKKPLKELYADFMVFQNDSSGLSTGTTKRLETIYLARFVRHRLARGTELRDLTKQELDVDRCSQERLSADLKLQYESDTSLHSRSVQKYTGPITWQEVASQTFANFMELESRNYFKQQAQKVIEAAPIVIQQLPDVVAMPILFGISAWKYVPTEQRNGIREVAEDWVDWALTKTGEAFENAYGSCGRDASKVIKRTQWSKETGDELSLWISDTNNAEKNQLKSIQVRGLTLCTILRLGPQVEDFIGDPRIFERWKEEAVRSFVFPITAPSAPDSGKSIKRATIPSEGKFDSRLRALERRLRSLRHSGFDLSSQTLFLGDDGTIGILWDEGAPGDEVIQFYRSHKAATMRRDKSGDLKYVGIATTIADGQGSSKHWARPSKADLFSSDNPKLIDFSLSLHEVTVVSTDIAIESISG